MIFVNVAIASRRRSAFISATPRLNSSSTRASPDLLHTVHRASSAIVRTVSSESRSAATSAGASSGRPISPRPRTPRRRSGGSAAGACGAGIRQARAIASRTGVLIEALGTFIGNKRPSAVVYADTRKSNTTVTDYNLPSRLVKGAIMRKLHVVVLALLAGLALSPIAYAADTPSGPQPTPKPKDPDLEAGRQ